jgi:diacylglycerol kinase family enzyme
MTATDEAAEQVDHADYDPVASLTGGGTGNAVALG